MTSNLYDFIVGFGIALTPMNLLYAFIGCLVGTLVGVLPGIGSAGGMVILLPLTYKLDPTGAIIMLAAIFYGSYYGGTISTVLMSVPGEIASVVTMLDGTEMARQGRAGPALSIAAIGLVHRRHGGGARPRAARPAPDGRRPEVRAAGVLRAAVHRARDAGAASRATRCCGRSPWRCSGSCSAPSARTRPWARRASTSASPTCSAASTSCPW